MGSRRGYAIAVCVLVGVLSGPSRVAVSQKARDADAQGRQGAPCIAFDVSSQQVWLQAKVNGRGPLWLMLDTGSMGSVLDYKRAAALGLEAVGTQSSLGAGGEQQGSTVHGVDLDLQGFQLRNQTMDTLALEGLSVTSGRPLEGILGDPLFQHTVVEIDYAGRCLRLYDADGYVYRGRGTIVPLTFKETHPYVTATVILPGGRSLKGKFVLDTGASSSLIISAESFEKSGAAAGTGKSIATQGHGVGGRTNVSLSRVESLEIGGFTLARPIAAIRPVGSGRVSAPGTLGNIGGGVLRRFKVIFDYSRKRMILEPGPDVRAPFESDMTGLGIVTRPPEFRRAVVAQVQSASPAFEAGVRAGDEILSVDGTPVAEIGVPALRERFRREGKEVKLVLQRGSDQINVALRTRRLI